MNLCVVGCTDKSIKMQEDHQERLQERRRTLTSSKTGLQLKLSRAGAEEVDWWIKLLSQLSLIAFCFSPTGPSPFFILQKMAEMGDICGHLRSIEHIQSSFVIHY
eukprot:TRINITY_DN21220_c0_g3_i1.p1 TRINITY_DN21220_c0_g3~~TRINITY_DN21220_c0_g3_i1.p1  ORF type:complete len:105 (-),score=24.13 TRINITY_DN21220_c0_g3_i1:651-965(-)